MGKTYHALWVHLVWGAKHRAPLIVPDLKYKLYDKMREIAKEKGLYLDFVNGVEGHVHLLVGLKPSDSIPNIVRNLKGITHDWVRDTYASDEYFHWQDGYAAISVSPDRVPTVRGYIKKQERHHQKNSFKTEWVFLNNRLRSIRIWRAGFVRSVGFHTSNFPLTLCFKYRLMSMFSRRFLPCILLWFTVPSVFAQIAAPFHRGVNLPGWFQANSAQQISFTRYTKRDFEQIKSLGCDVIRLPINLHYMTDGAPNYTLDPLLLFFLDEAVNWAEALDLHLILDNHTFDPAVDTDPNVGAVLNKVWLQMAQHFKNRSNLIYYEILNEPHGISDSLWNAIQQSAVTAIRTVDDKHTIIVGGAGWNGYNHLAPMPAYSDSNLIYTFHFYEPFLFTHQGASWTQPSLEPLSGMPFPFHAANMPPLPPSLEGTWVNGAYDNYANEGTAAHVQALLDIAIQFRDARQAPVFCGELGVYMLNSNPDDRVFWYQIVSQYLNAHNIAWTTWDYHGEFGLFEPNSEGFFDHDLNVPLLESLGFNVPPQSPFVLKPDSAGFFIYSDYVAPKMFDASYSDGIVNFYSKDLPNNGHYCIRWSGAAQYDVLAFDFRPDKDLTYLRAQGYALDLLVRGDTPGTSFDLRFTDTDTDDPNDRPWRVTVTIDDSHAAWDGRWRHLHIPLSHFTESGAWEDGVWYNPQGLFDWTAIDRFEIVAEQGGLQGVNFWFDNIQVTNLDTALVYETGVFSSVQAPFEKMRLVVAPNPAADFVALKSSAPLPVQWRLTDLLGRPVRRGRFTQATTVDVSTLPPGCYGLYWETGNWSGTEKIVKY